jgi:potassium-transporting ATPase KdpC subunit
MKTHILPTLKLTLACILLCCFGYTLLILLMAQFSPNKAEGQTVKIKGVIKGYALEGQLFTQDKYFNGRPSAAGYNAAGSSGSNKGPTNPDYLKDVQIRIDSFLVHNPSIKKEAIPSELVTSSGSGLDPDISPIAAQVQIARIALNRNIKVEKIKSLVANKTQKPLLGLFGTARVNVLELNIALDNLSK